MLSEFILDDLNDPHASAPTSIKEHLSSPSFSTPTKSYIPSSELIANVKQEVLNLPTDTSLSQTPSVSTPVKVLESVGSTASSYSPSVLESLSVRQCQSGSTQQYQYQKIHNQIDPPKPIIQSSASAPSVVVTTASSEATLTIL